MTRLAHDCGTETGSTVEGQWELYLTGSHGTAGSKWRLATLVNRDEFWAGNEDTWMGFIKN